MIHDIIDTTGEINEEDNEKGQLTGTSTKKRNRTSCPTPAERTECYQEKQCTQVFQ